MYDPGAEMMGYDKIRHLTLSRTMVQGWHARHAQHGRKIVEKRAWRQQQHRKPRCSLLPWW